MTTAIEQPPAQQHPAQVNAAQRIEELGRIIMAYSEVTDRLQQSHEKLEQTVAALREELGEKNRLLERRNRLAALGEMAAGLAHEIRNPLGGIRLYASMLTKDLADRPEAVAIVSKMAGGVQRLEGLVSQVLHFSREIRPSVMKVELRQVVEQQVELAEPALRASGSTVRVEGPERLEATVDPILIGQAVLNLVLNAAEACERGVVRVELGGAGDEARQFRLTVEDTGPGIPADVIDRIFNPFFTTKDNGTGLGLAIVHRIVEAHDGTIVARNGEDGGARFEIRI